MAISFTELANDIQSKLAENAPPVSIQVSGLSFVAEVDPLAPSSFKISNKDGSAITSKTLLTALLGEIPSGMPNLNCDKFTLHKKPDSEEYVLRIPFDDEWKISLGVQQLKVKNVVVTVEENEGEMSGVLVGKCAIAGHESDVKFSLPGEVVLSGALAPIDLLQLVESLIGPVLKLPDGLPPIKLRKSSYSIALEDESPTLVFRTSAENFEDVAVVFTQVDGSWGALAKVKLETDGVFSKLSDALSPLDELLPVDSPWLVLSSFESDEFEAPSVEGVEFEEIVKKGLSLLASLKLDGGLLGLIGKIIGMSELPLSLSATDSLSSATIVARREGTITVIPNCLTLDNVTLNIDPSAADPIEPSADAHVNLFGVDLPLLKLGYSPTGTINLSTKVPFDLPAVPTMKLRVNETVIGYDPKESSYAVGADVTFAEHQGKFGVKILGQIPTLLLVKIPGKLSLGDVVHELIGQSIPAIVDQSIENFDLRYATQPQVFLHEQIDMGFSLSGKFGIVGLEMDVKVIINSSKIYAHGSLDKKVDVGGVFIVSDAAGDGPPSMTLDTTSAEILRLTGRAELLGLSQSIEATVNKSGFTVAFDQDLGIAHFKLDSRYRSPVDFSAEGECRYGIDVTTGPIQLTPGTPSLGQLKIDAGFGGSVTLEVVDQTFSGSVTGGFRWNNDDFHIRPIKLTVAPSSLAEIPTLVNNMIRDNAAEIFAALLQDGGKWLKAVADGLVKGVTNAATVLRGVYNQTAQQIGEGLSNTLHQSADQVAQGLKAIGESPQSIASVLNKLEKPPEELANALKSIGEVPERIASLLRDLGYQAQIVRDTLTRLGVPADQISRIMRDTFPMIPHLDTVVHTDAHVDSPVVPHADVHLDTPLIPPVRQHTDTPLIPPVRQHTDTPLIPHIDAHTDFREPGISNHGDRRIGPPGARVHVDTHQDVPGPHGDVHGDRGGVGHADHHIDEPGQAHADHHIDEPGQVHGDIHTDEPSHGRIETHSDTAIHTDVP